jgi:ribosomal protein S18 acetylase RimI-like enzyme
MPGDLRVERARESDRSTVEYLERDLVRNATDIWLLKQKDRRYELHVCRAGSEVKAHLGAYSAPEAVYAGLGGDSGAAELLLPLVPNKAVVTIPRELYDLAARMLSIDATYRIDFMVVRNGEERLRDCGLAKRLSREYAVEYASFGSSFNISGMTLEWAREQLDTDIIFGVFADGRLASVASLVAWSPQVAAITGVETKPAFRRRGLGSVAVSAAVQEAFRRSRSCSLYVRSDNEEARRLYEALGFEKLCEGFFIDVGSGVNP